MILNHNALLYELYDKKFTIEIDGGSWINNYTEGDLFELWDYLSQKNIKYPVIWLQTGYSVETDIKEDRNRISLNGCKLFFICKGDLNDPYQKRFDTTYTNMLYPLLNKFLSYKQGVTLSDDIRYKTLPFNAIDGSGQLMNDSSLKGQKASIQDIWDAIYLEIDIHLDKECFPEFIIK